MRSIPSGKTFSACFLDLTPLLSSGSKSFKRNFLPLSTRYGFEKSDATDIVMRSFRPGLRLIISAAPSNKKCFTRCSGRLENLEILPKLAKKRTARPNELDEWLKIVTQSR